MKRHCLLLVAFALALWVSADANAQMISTQYAKKLILADGSAALVPLTLKAPASLTSGAYDLTFPATLPAGNGYLLSSSTNGTLSWVDPASYNFLTGVSHNSTLTGAGTSGSPLAIDLTNTNSWSGTQSFAINTGQGNALIASINAASSTINAATVGIGLTNAQVNDDLTISGGTINGTPIGATTASTGRFTTITGTSLPSGSTSTNIVTSNSGALETRVATEANTASTLVLRDASGNFSAGTITADVTGNVSGTSSNVTGTVAVGNGGTGATTLTSNGVLYGNGTGAVQATDASSSAGQFLTSASAGASPIWGSVPIMISGGVQGLQSGNINPNPFTEYSAPMGWFSSTQNDDTVGITRILIPRSGTIKNLYVIMSNSPAGTGGNANTRKFTITKTSPGSAPIATSLTLTITSPNRTGNDLTHSFTVNAGDEISMQITSRKVGSTQLAASNVDWGFILETP